MDHPPLADGRPNRLFKNMAAKTAALPMIFVALCVFLGGTLWTITFSFTKSKLLPKTHFVGFDQYERLWGTTRWIVSIENLAIFGFCMLFICIVGGFILAALLDQRIRFENFFRTVLLYPFAMSFIVTGLAWQWILNPEFGIQASVQAMGWTGFHFDPLHSPQYAIYGILIAGVWQVIGFNMVLMLAGLRGIDEDIWKASKVEGIPAWKTYIFVVVPMMKPVFVTAIVMLSSAIIKAYDLVVAQTGGGPGTATEVPAKFVYDYMFGGGNLGLGLAAATMMLVAAIFIIIPWAILEFGQAKHG